MTYNNVNGYLITIMEHGEKAPQEGGGRIRFPLKLYQQYRQMTNFYVALAILDGTIIGQAFYLKEIVSESHPITWVLQLIVHEQYRMRGIAKTLLYSIWGFSDDYVWGVATSNALTVKTLEKATFRKVSPIEMIKHKDKILMLKETIPFAKDAEMILQDNMAVLNSGFPVECSVVEENLKLYDGNWLLGTLPVGHEWPVFTFQSQKYEITQKEYDEMFENSEKIVSDAYNRMDLSKQAWNRHQKEEVNFILERLKGKDISQVIDFGCGNGRHVLEFAQQGFKVIGIDYSEKNIQCAQKEETQGDVRFIKDDCRTAQLNEKADLALCLYDVVGSFVNADDNQAIIDNIYRHLNSHGFLVMSVMNLELTNSIAKHKVPNVRENLEMLVNLKPSRTMQRSRNIFNPEYFLLETETGVVYRKEQFGNEGELSAEYAIHDKRYSREEICSMLRRAGFMIRETRYVQAGYWDIPLGPQEPSAKEILIFAEK